MFNCKSYTAYLNEKFEQEMAVENDSASASLQATKCAVPAKNESLLTQYAYWKRHAFHFLMNESDSLAFFAYGIAMQSASGEIVPMALMWKQWTKLSDEENDKYYKKVPELAALLAAESAFRKHKAAMNGGFIYDSDGLLNEWNSLSTEEKLSYAGSVYQDRIKYEEDPANRFIGPYNDPNGVLNVSTIDDINAKLMPIYPFSKISSMHHIAFIVFMEINRPELLKDPKVAKKRYWAVNTMLFNKWRKEMSHEDKQQYRNMAKRFVQIKATIHADLNEWKFSACDVYCHELKKNFCPNYFVTMDEWNNVNAETKKQCVKTALKYRRGLLRLYPDLYEYYAWIRSEVTVLNDKPETPKTVTDEKDKTETDFAVSVSSVLSDSEAFSVFLAEKVHLLRQLKPFTSTDNNVLNEILGRAWKKFSDNDKAYYVQKMFVPNANTNLAKSKMEKNEPPVNGELDPYQIYHDEMRLIVLQDFTFVRNNFNAMSEMFKQGWEELTEQQRLAYYERVVADAENKKNATIQSSNSATLNGADYIDTTQTLTVESQKDLERQEDSYVQLTNESDALAFTEYVRTMKSLSVAQTNRDMWTQWAQLSDEEQDGYYDQVPLLYALQKSAERFVEEKTTLKPGDMNYCYQQRELRETWKLICDEAKVFYAGSAYQERLKYEEDPENRFIGLYNERKFGSNFTTIDDVNSTLTLINPFQHVREENEDTVFIIFMELNRPELLKDPEVAKKRFWEVNVMLKEQWLTEMSYEDVQKYFDMAHRFIEIKTAVDSKLNEWQIYAKDVYCQEMKAKLSKPGYAITLEEWKNIDATSKQKYAEIALQNRKVLLKMYPDLHQYYAWIRCDDFVVEAKEVASGQPSTPVASKNAVDKELEAAIQLLAEKKVHLNGSYLRYTDVVDRAAFWKYKEKVTSVSAVCLDMDALWRQFVRLSSEEQAIYYGEVLKEESLLEARKLFARDNCPTTKNEVNSKESAKLLPELYQKWEKISAPSKQYYLDMAEKQLLQRKKQYTEDIEFYPPTVSYLETKDAVNKPNSVLRNLYANFDFAKRGITNDEKACMVYMRKKFSELLKEPGMADKRYFQLKLILALRFAKLSGKERKPYCDMVQQIKDIQNHILEFPVSQHSVMTQKFGNTQQWNKLSEEDKAICFEESQQNRWKLVETYPDLHEHYRYILFHSEATEALTPKDHVQSEVSKTQVNGVEEKNVEVNDKESNSLKASKKVVEETQHGVALETQDIVADEKDMEVSDGESECSFEDVANDNSFVTQEAPASPNGDSDSWELVKAENEPQ